MDAARTGRNRWETGDGGDRGRWERVYGERERGRMVEESGSVATRKRKGRKGWRTEGRNGEGSSEETEERLEEKET